MQNMRPVANGSPCSVRHVYLETQPPKTVGCLLVCHLAPSKGNLVHQTYQTASQRGKSRPWSIGVHNRRIGSGFDSRERIPETGRSRLMGFLLMQSKNRLDLVQWGKAIFSSAVSTYRVPQNHNSKETFSFSMPSPYIYIYMYVYIYIYVCIFLNAVKGQILSKWHEMCSLCPNKRWQNK